VRAYYKPGLKELLVEWKLESRLNLRAEIQDGRIGYILFPLVIKIAPSRKYSKSRNQCWVWKRGMCKTTSGIDWGVDWGRVINDL
jgi:hypothetical protein